MMFFSLTPNPINKTDLAWLDGSDGLEQFYIYSIHIYHSQVINAETELSSGSAAVISLAEKVLKYQVQVLLPPSGTSLNLPANSSKIFKVSLCLRNGAPCSLWNTQRTLIVVFLILWAFRSPHILLIVHWDSFRWTQSAGVTLNN